MATTAETTRDYGLTGADSRRALDSGLVEAQWYRPPIDAERLRRLTTRTNARAGADTALWLGLLAGSALVAWSLRHSWWAILAFVVYGALYGGASDARWHECGHGTAFRSRAANDIVYVVASFMLLREPTMWRWSHFRHHSDTIVVGRDPEIAFARPFRLRTALPNYLHLLNGPKMLWRMVRHAFGSLDDDALDFVPPSELRRVVWEARILVMAYAAVLGWAIAVQSIVPLLFIGLPAFYGAWLLWLFATTQHAGLREDVLDHRLNTRTVYMNPVFRFLYLNMNYHVEHHLFPTVPYYALPALHAEIGGYLVPASPSVLAAYREIVPTLLRQRRDPSWEIEGRIIPKDLLVATGIGEPLPRTVAARTDLGPASAVELGRIVRVDVGSATFAICQPEPGVFAVTAGMCTHGQTHLAGGRLEGCVIECPKHNGRFDVRTGKALRRPATVPLATYPVEVVDGRIVVDLRTGIF